MARVVGDATPAVSVALDTPPIHLPSCRETTFSAARPRLHVGGRSSLMDTSYQLQSWTSKQVTDIVTAIMGVFIFVAFGRPKGF